MFGYYFDLALRSLTRNPVLTALMVLAIGLGIGARMTMITVLHVMSGDPLPVRSAQLFTPHLDSLPLDYKQDGDGPDPVENLTWPDAMALFKAHRAERQAAMEGGQLLVRPGQVGTQPFDVDGRYATADFFAMFGLAFERGSGWTSAENTARARVPYVLRSAPQDRQQVLKAAVDALIQLDPNRLIPPRMTRTFMQMRAAYFQRDTTMISLLAASALGLLFVTALGIAGLANFWVQQRRRTIGIRRAVGATRGDILRYFLTENFPIVTLGILLGLLLALGLNLLLMTHYELSRLPFYYLPIGAVLLWGSVSLPGLGLRCAQRQCRRWWRRGQCERNIENAETMEGVDGSLQP